MMKTISIPFLLLFILLSACQGKENRNVAKRSTDTELSDSLVYQVINYLLYHRDLNPDLKADFIVEKENMPFLFSFKNDSLALTKMDSLFKKEDIVFIFSQKMQFEKFMINPKYIQDKTIIRSDSLKNPLYKSHSTISYPLFNIKKDIFIIRTSYYCGVLCGHQGTYIYQKKGSGWLLLKTLNEVVY